MDVEMSQLTGRKPRFYKGDIVYGYLRPYLNKVWRAEFDGLCSVDQYVFSVNQQLAEPEYIAWFMRSPTYLKRAPISSSPGQLPRIRTDEVANVIVPLPSLGAQRIVVEQVNRQMKTVQEARAAVESQLVLVDKLIESYLRRSLRTSPSRRVVLSECLVETVRGVGAEWRAYRLVGATRSGLAAAKEPAGKSPERYKLVLPGTIFYNPMRILLGSIAMVNADDEPGITSPDYVVFQTREGLLDPRWFYYWLRSHYGENFIKALTRGAVRERMLFRRLASAQIDIPSWDTQYATAKDLKSAERLRRALSEQLALIEKLPPAILQQAFADEGHPLAESNGGSH